jgi:hypothetical protein
MKMSQTAQSTAGSEGSGAEEAGKAYLEMEAMGFDVHGGASGDGVAAPPAALQGPQDLIPAKYKDRNTSGLSAEVTESGPNEFPFDLT